MCRINIILIMLKTTKLLISATSEYLARQYQYTCVYPDHVFPWRSKKYQVCLIEKCPII